MSVSFLRLDHSERQAAATASTPLATCCVYAGPGSRIDVVLANRISKHALCDVGLVSGIGIPTHLPVAAVFQFAEYEQMVTTNARKKKIDANFKDLDRVVDILTRQSTAWFWAVQQKRAEILGAVVRSLLAQANETEAQHSESVNWQRTSQLEKTAEKCNSSIRIRRSTKSSDTPAGQVGKTSTRSRQTIQRHVVLVSCLSVVPWSMLRLFEKLRQSGEGFAQRSVLGCCEAASFPISGAGEPLGVRSQGGSERMTIWEN